MNYFGGCDVGTTDAKCVILDEKGKMVGGVSIRSKINAEKSSAEALAEVRKKVNDVGTPDTAARGAGTKEDTPELPA